VISRERCETSDAKTTASQHGFLAVLPHEMTVRQTGLFSPDSPHFRVNASRQEGDDNPRKFGYKNNTGLSLAQTRGC